MSRQGYVCPPLTLNVTQDYKLPHPQSLSYPFFEVLMRVVILRRFRNASISMDVYADGLVQGLSAVRPDWEIKELAPRLDSSEMKAAKKGRGAFLLNGVRKYYERYWRFPRSLKAENADIFHIVDHSDGHLISWLKKYRKPVVITCHDLINLVAPETFENRAQLPAISMKVWEQSVRAMKNADRVVSVSSHTKKDVIESLNIEEDTVCVVPNAVDPVFKPLPTEIRQQFRQQEGIVDKFCLLNVGSNHSRKNVSSILKALPILKARGIPVHFWKVGKDFTSEQQGFIEHHGLRDNITFFGQPTLNDLIKTYSSADVLVAPSTYEGFGLTILEAMACGLPVITSNVTSLPEVAGDAAILVKPNDVEAIAAGIKQLHQDPDYHQALRQKGLARAATFSWKNTGTRVANIYEKVISKQY